MHDYLTRRNGPGVKPHADDTPALPPPFQIAQIVVFSPLYSELPVGTTKYMNYIDISITIRCKNYKNLMELSEWKGIREVHGSSNVSTNCIGSFQACPFVCSKQRLDEYQSHEFIADLYNTGPKPTDQLPTKEENQSLSNGGE